jgi:hypothetical protein
MDHSVCGSVVRRQGSRACRSESQPQDDPCREADRRARTLPQTRHETRTSVMPDNTLSDLLFQIDAEGQERSLGQLVMLRNFIGLPDSKPGNDIDLIVRRRDLPGWEAALTAAAKTLSINVALTCSDYYFSSFVYARDGVEITKIDLNHDFAWRGVTFMDMDRVLNNIELYRQPIYICASAPDRAFVTLCHSLLYGGFINTKYLDEFAIHLRIGSEFGDHLQRVFGRDMAQKLGARILAGDVDMPRSEANRARITALSRSALRMPFSTMRGLARSLRGPVTIPS